MVQPPLHGVGGGGVAGGGSSIGDNRTIIVVLIWPVGRIIVA